MQSAGPQKQKSVLRVSLTRRKVCRSASLTCAERRASASLVMASSSRVMRSSRFELSSAMVVSFVMKRLSYLRGIAATLPRGPVSRRAPFPRPRREIARLQPVRCKAILLSRVSC